MAETRVPWCDCSGANGYTNAKYRETGDLKDQWLHGDCGRPSRIIFHDTDRWKAEREQWYGGQVYVPAPGPVREFLSPITGERADLMPVDQVADQVRLAAPHRSWDECLDFARTLIDLTWTWMDSEPFRVCFECEYIWTTRPAFIADVRAMEAENGFDGMREDLDYCPHCSHDF